MTKQQKEEAIQLLKKEIGLAYVDFLNNLGATPASLLTIGQVNVNIIRFIFEQGYIRGSNKALLCGIKLTEDMLKLEKDSILELERG